MLAHLNIATFAVVGVLSLVFLWFAAKSTETWLIVAILAHLILALHRREVEGTSVFQAVAYSFLFFPGLIWWFAKKISSGGKIVENWAEFMFVLFLFFALMSIGWAYIDSFSVVKGVREFILFIPYLMIFPMRDYVAEKGAQKIIWAFLIVCIVAAISSIVEYRSAIEVAKFFWQVGASRVRANAAIFLGSVIILYGFIAAKKYNQVLVIAILSMTTIGLVMTFSRGYWIVAIMGIFILSVITKGNARKRVVIFTLISIGSMAAIAFAIFPRMIIDLAEGLLVRFASSNLSDISLQSRFSESLAVLQKIKLSPIIGYGLGAEFSFFDPITYQTATTWYIHNGYLWLIFKFGFVGSFLFLSFYAYMYVKTVSTASRIGGADKIMLLSFVTLMTIMLIINLTSPQFYDRGGILVLSMMWGISAGVRKKESASKLGMDG